MSIAALLTETKIQQQPVSSMDEWIQKMWYIYKYIHHTCTIEYYSVIKKKDLAIFDNTDGSRGHYAKLNESDQERQILYDLTYIWNLKKQNTLANITKRNRRIDTENK